VYTQTLVTLSGSGTDSYNDLPLTYFWTQIGGEAVVLHNQSSASPYFTTPMDPGLLTFSLMVTDSLGLPDSTPDIVEITVNNKPPISNAGTDQSVNTLSLVHLSGSGVDMDGDLPLTYHWTQTGGTAVELSNLNVANPTFTAPSDPGILTFSLTVTDSLALSDPTPDAVEITVNNQSPYSNAGPDQSVDTLSFVTLNGSGSSDPDLHYPLTYQWIQIGGTTVILSSSTSATPTFTAPDDSDVLTFALTVTDNLGLPDPTPDEVVITVNPYQVFLPMITR